MGPHYSGYPCFLLGTLRTNAYSSAGGAEVASETEQELRRYLEGVHFVANTEDLEAPSIGEQLMYQVTIGRLWNRSENCQV
jgi:hypothetical protein